MTKIAACANPKCKSEFTRKNKQHRFCSGKCSAYMRNYRYYETRGGRLKKREAARRYFQNHKLELYEKKRIRFERYVNEVIASEGKEALKEQGWMQAWRCPTTPPDNNLILRAARRIARVQHDWHPTQQGDTPLGRPLWNQRHPEYWLPGRRLNEEEVQFLNCLIPTLESELRAPGLSTTRRDTISRQLSAAKEILSLGVVPWKIGWEKS